MSNIAEKDISAAVGGKSDYHPGAVFISPMPDMARITSNGIEIGSPENASRYRTHLSTIVNSAYNKRQWRKGFARPGAGISLAPANGKELPGNLFSESYAATRDYLIANQLSIDDAFNIGAALIEKSAEASEAVNEIDVKWRGLDNTGLPALHLSSVDQGVIAGIAMYALPTMLVRPGEVEKAIHYLDVAGQLGKPAFQYMLKQRIADQDGPEQKKLVELLHEKGIEARPASLTR